MNQFVKDLVERAVKTFIQVFAATLVIPAVSDIYSVDAWKAAVVSAAAAGLSAVMSLLSKRVGPSKDDASVVV